MISWCWYSFMSTWSSAGISGPNAGALSAAAVNVVQSLAVSCALYPPPPSRRVGTDLSNFGGKSIEAFLIIIINCQLQCREQTWSNLYRARIWRIFRFHRWRGWSDRWDRRQDNLRRIELPLPKDERPRRHLRKAWKWFRLRLRNHHWRACYTQYSSSGN